MLDTKPSDQRVKPGATVPEMVAQGPQRTESRELSENPLSPATSGTEPSSEEITSLAYQLWVERGSPHGSHEQDWHQAEAQLRSRQTLVKTPKAAKAGA